MGIIRVILLIIFLTAKLSAAPIDQEEIHKVKLKSLDQLLMEGLLKTVMIFVKILGGKTMNGSAMGLQ